MAGAGAANDSELRPKVISKSRDLPNINPIIELLAKPPASNAIQKVSREAPPQSLTFLEDLCRIEER